MNSILRVVFAAIFALVVTFNLPAQEPVTSTISGWSEKDRIGEISFADVAPSGGGDLSTLDVSKMKVSGGTPADGIVVAAVVGKAEPTNATVFVKVRGGAFGSFDIDLDGDGTNEVVFEIPQPEAVKAIAVWEKSKRRVSEVVIPHTAGNTYVVITTAKGIGDFTKTAPTIGVVDGPADCFKAVAVDVKSASVVRALVEFPARMSDSRAVRKVGVKVGSDPRSAVFEFAMVSEEQYLRDRVKRLETRGSANSGAALKKVNALEVENASLRGEIDAVKAEVAALKAPVESFAGSIQAAVEQRVAPVEAAQLELGNRVADVEADVVAANNAASDAREIGEKALGIASANAQVLRNQCEALAGNIQSKGKFWKLDAGRFSSLGCEAYYGVPTPERLR